VIRQAVYLVRAFFRRDLALDLSYKTAIALEGLDLAIGAAAFYYFARVMGERRPDGYDAFAFLLIGVAVNNAMTTTLTCFAQAVRADRQHGVSKPLAVAPLHSSAVLALSAVYPVLRALTGAVACLGAGALLGLSFTGANVAAVLTAGAFATAAFAAVGVLSAVFTLILQRGDPVLWLFGTLSWLLGGVFFPVTVLPPPLQQVSSLLPMTHALDAVRATLLNGAAVRDVRGDLAVLALIAGVGLVLGIAGLSFADTRNRQTGEHNSW
jgi:ABC-2 type transport system permease protein